MARPTCLVAAAAACLAIMTEAKIIDVSYLLEGLEGKPASGSRSRHATWHAESEAALNAHIALEMAAAYQYRAMWAYCLRDSVNLKGAAKYFKESAAEEWGHAEALMAYQVKRGGVAELAPLDAPVHEFGPTGDGADAKADARVAFESALAMEKKVYDSLLGVHAVCAAHNDPICQDELEEYIAEQVSAVDQLARYVADLDRVGPSGHAVWQWDREELEDD